MTKPAPRILRTHAERRRAIFDEALEHLKTEPVHLVLFESNVRLRERLSRIASLPHERICDLMERSGVKADGAPYDCAACIAGAKG